MFPRPRKETLCKYFAICHFHSPCQTNLSRLSETPTARWRSHGATQPSVWERQEPATNWRQYLAFNSSNWRRPANCSCYIKDAGGIWTVHLLKGMQIFYLHSNILFIQRKFIICFLSYMIRFTASSYQVQTHIVSAKSCEIQSLLTVVTTDTASDAEGKMQRCRTCDLGSEFKLRSPTKDVSRRKCI